MVDPTRLLALAEECERATGPSFDLERRISWAVGRRAYQAPYTASLDSALILVPEGFYWLVGAGRVRPVEPMFGAQILRGSFVVSGGESNSTAALALCAAALRALAEGAE